MTRRTPQDAQGAVFVSRSTAAARLQISVDTFDTWYKDRFLPEPAINRGNIRRWHWPTIEERLAGDADAAPSGS